MKTIHRIKEHLLKFLYRKFTKRFTPFIKDLIQYETLTKQHPSGGRIQEQIKSLFCLLDDNQVIKEMYEKHARDNQEHISYMFDKYNFNDQCIFIRTIQAKHGRYYVLITCIYKNNKTVFTLISDNNDQVINNVNNPIIETIYTDFYNSFKKQAA
jgi:hypothetical protein